MPPALRSGVATKTPPRSGARRTPPDSPSTMRLTRSVDSSPNMARLAPSPCKPPSSSRALRYANSPQKLGISSSPRKTPCATPPLSGNCSVKCTPIGQRVVLSNMSGKWNNWSTVQGDESPDSDASAYTPYMGGSPCDIMQRNGVVEDLLTTSPGLTKTAIKRVVHDSKTKGLTFNQKKHRSPSHVRRSERRQQQRLASGSPASCCASQSPPPRQLSPGGMKDPWEEEENLRPFSQLTDQAVSTARQMLDFGGRGALARSMR